MAPRRQPLRIPSPGTQATPDSGDHGRVVFPSTPQHTQAPRGLQLDAGLGVASAEPGRPRIPRAKSSGDVHASRFSQRSAVAAAAAGAAIPSGAMLMAPVASVMSSHAVVQHVEAVQIASQQGAFTFREGFTESPLGAGRMHVTPTDVLICIGAASAKSAGAAAATNEGYAPTAQPPVASSHYQSPTVRSPTVPSQSLPTYLDAARQASSGGKDFTKEADRSSDRFIHLARLAIASVTFYAAGSGNAFGGSETGTLRRERSLAQLQASTHNRSSLEIRTRDFCLVTVCFSSSVRATDAVINELLRPPAVNLFRSSPLRPQPHHLYGVSSLALRLQFPMKLVAAGLHRASLASGGAAVGLDLGPTVSQPAAPGPSDTDPLQVCTPGTQNQAAFPIAQDAPPAAAAGWFVYDPAAEMERQQFPRGRPVGAAKEADATWPVRLCHVNADYSVCPSYPPVLVEPRDATDQMVIDEARNRTRSRVQTCAFVYEPTRNCLFRSSQPRNGGSLLGWMITADESPLMGSIRRSCATQELKVVDLRPYANAIGNSLFRGGGHEATRRKGTEVLFANIENVDHVNTAYNEVAQLCFAHHSASNCSRSASTPPSAFLSAVAKTAWLDLLHAVLGASVRVARFIAGVDGPGSDAYAAGATRAPRASLGGAGAVPSLAGANVGSGCNVLIHCSDGWDRTAQVSALAQLLLDPWFRTLRGFCVLVEKEFLHCGHQFASRAHFPRVTTLGEHDLPADPAFHTGLRPEPSTTASSLVGESTQPTPQKAGLPRGAMGADGWDALEHHDAAGDHDDGDDWDHSDCHEERDCASPNLMRTPPAAPFAGGGRQSVASNGHHGRVRTGGGGHEACPIFVQFIDAVHQLVEVYPAEFEFTPQALIWLLDAYHSGFYSTFACDNHSQLVASGLIGRHTANALGELAGLGGSFAHHHAGSEASSAKGMPTAAAPAGRQMPNTSSSYVDVGSLTETAMGSAASPAESTPVEGTTPPQTSGAANTSVMGPLANPNYSWDAASSTGALLGLIGPQRLRLWEDYFCRYSDGVQPVAVAGRSCVPESALQPRRLSKLAAAGGSFESFDALSASMAEWQSVGGSRVSSPNNYGTVYPPGQRAVPQGPQAVGGGTPAGSARGDDSPAPPPSPGKPARIAASQMCMPAFQAKKFQENWN